MKLIVISLIVIGVALILAFSNYGRLFAVLKAEEVRITQLSSEYQNKEKEKIIDVDGFLEASFDVAMGKSSDRHFKLYFKHGDGEYNFFKNLYDQNKPSAFNPEVERQDIIPKVIHQIWIGNNPLPTKYAFFQDTVKANNENWRYVLWDESKIRSEKFADYDLYEKARTYAEKADIARYMILKKFGGVYIDVDTFCLRGLAPMLKYEFFAGIEPHNKSGYVHIANGIIGASKGHSVLNYTLKIIRENWEQYEAQFENGKLGGYKIENLVRTRTFFPFDTAFKHHAKLHPKNIIALPAGYFYPVYYEKGYFKETHSYSMTYHDFSKSRSEIKLFKFADFWSLYKEPSQKDQIKFETIKLIFKKNSPDNLPYKGQHPISSLIHVFTEDDQELNRWKQHYPDSKIIKWSDDSNYKDLKFASLLSNKLDPRQNKLLLKLVVLYNFGGVVIDGLSPDTGLNEFAQLILELNDKYDLYSYLEENEKGIMISEKLIGSRAHNQLIEKILMSLDDVSEVDDVFNDICYKYIYLGSNIIFPKSYFE